MFRTRMTDYSMDSYLTGTHLRQTAKLQSFPVLDIRAHILEHTYRLYIPAAGCSEETLPCKRKRNPPKPRLDISLAGLFRSPMQDRKETAPCLKDMQIFEQRVHHRLTSNTKIPCEAEESTKTLRAQFIGQKVSLCD